MTPKKQPERSESMAIEEEVIEAVKKISPKRAGRIAKHRKKIEKMLTD